jgi:hypothetical protein
VLKKMIAAGGLLVTAASGTAIATPALAQTPAWGGGCCSSSHSNFFQNHRNRNWNGTENEGFNHIRLRLHNRNNNIAVARNEDDGRRRD